MGVSVIRSFLFFFIAITSVLASPISFSANHVKALRPRAGVPTLDGDAISMSNGTGDYPRGIRRQDGALLVIYAQVQDANRQLVTIESNDNGATWETIGSVATEEAATHDLTNGFLFQLEGGRILASFRNHERETDGTYINFRLHVCASDDNGATWKFLSTLVEDQGPEPGPGDWEPFMRYAQDGSTIQAFYSHEVAETDPSTDQDSIMKTSTDGGATWSDPITWSGADTTNARDGMIGVASVDGPNLVAVFETTESGRFSIYAQDSADDGATWTNRREIYAPEDSTKDAGAPQIANIGGTLVVSFMTNEDDDDNTWSSPDGFGAQAKIITSTDGGATWGNKLSVFDVESNWQGLLPLSDTEVLLMTTYNGEAWGQKISVA
jgi:hypothetical protein